MPTYELVGSGEGVVATGGKTVPVTWKKDAQDAPMRLFAADGVTGRPRSGQHVGRAGARPGPGSLTVG